MESLALWYVDHPDAVTISVAYGLIILGAIGAFVFYRSQARLRRAPYFFMVALISFVFILVQFVWLAAIPAVRQGFVWVLLSVDFLACVAAGFAYAVAAIARARDAGGSRRMAILAFIPLLNLWLMLAPSKDDAPADGRPAGRLMPTGLALLAGLALLVAGAGLQYWFRTQAAQIAQTAATDSSSQEAVSAMLVREHGIEATIRQLAAQTEPGRMDEATSLVEVEGDGTTLRYVYEVEEGFGVDASADAIVIDDNCQIPLLRALIDEGAVIEHVYLRTDGSPIRTIEVTRGTCPG